MIPAAATADEALVARQAIAGLMWGKQFYHFDVERWLTGDPGSAPPPAGRRHGRNSAWWHMNSFDVISMPDPWEYPWYAAWDLAFHCVTIARVDPGFAKEQLLLLLREWYLHPNGQIPAYEWAFGDVNPPVHAWAALKVFEIDGSRDHEFLARVMHKLLLNFTWWVNRKDTGGNNVFEGGFLGLDNVGPFDRSAALPVAGVLEQSDGTGWMAMYALNLLDMAIVLAEHDRAYADTATKFFEHFAYIAAAAYEQGLWDAEDAFFYDVLRLADGTKVPLQGPLGGRAAAAGSRHPAHRPHHAPPARAGRAAALVPHQPPRVRRGDRRPPDRAGRPPAAAAVDGRPGPGGAAAGPDARHRRVPLRVRAAYAVPRPPGQAVHRHRSAGRSSASATSRPSRPAACSAATPTGAARSGCRRTSC